jgi:hypothetical protein
MLSEPPRKSPAFASGVYGYYKTAMSLANDLGLFGPGESQFQRLAKQIEALTEKIRLAFAEMLGAQRAEFTLETKRDITHVRTPAITAVNTIALHWGTPEMDARSVLEDTLKAITELSSDESYWLRTFYEQAAYRDPWTPPQFPTGVTKTGDYQWDYVLFLPSYLEVLACRVVVLCMLVPDKIASKHKPFLLSTRTSSSPPLEDVLGLKTLRMPTFEEARFRESWFLSRGRRTYSSLVVQTGVGSGKWEWRLANGRLYGAFNVWSTESSIESYPLSLPSPLGQGLKQSKLKQPSGRT